METSLHWKPPVFETQAAPITDLEPRPCHCPPWQIPNSKSQMSKLISAFENSEQRLTDSDKLYVPSTSLLATIMKYKVV
jgi:hypothetical protein